MSEANKKCCNSRDINKNGAGYIHGISCDVKNCYFNDSCEHCTAKNIVVGPSYAESSKETVCSTFKPREE